MSLKTLRKACKLELVVFNRFDTKISLRDPKLSCPNHIIWTNYKFNIEDQGFWFFVYNFNVGWIRDIYAYMHQFPLDLKYKFTICIRVPRDYPTSIKEQCKCTKCFARLANFPITKDCQVFNHVGQLPWTRILVVDWAKMIEPSYTTSSLCPGLGPL